MIRTDNASAAYGTIVRNGRQELMADAPIDKGGNGAGFGAHELLEAALATCINMSVRMHADKHGIPLEGVVVQVAIERPDDQTTRFVQTLTLSGSLTPKQMRELEGVASECPVRQSISKRLEFELSHQRTPEAGTCSLECNL